MTKPATSSAQLTAENYDAKVFRFRDRQAGVGLVYDPLQKLYTYNAYCIELALVKELYAVEYAFLEDALARINEEFGTWELVDIAPEKSGCSTCVAH